MNNADRGDKNFTPDEIKRAYGICKNAIAEKDLRNGAGMGWYGGLLVDAVGMDRARRLLGRHADAVLKHVKMQ